MFLLAHCENKKMNSRVNSSKDLNLIGILSKMELGGFQTGIRVQQSLNNTAQHGSLARWSSPPRSS